MKINKKEIARHLRQQQTPAEEMLWELLRNRQFEDLKFTRQHPLKDYIVDFYCDELELIIELDGGYHEAKDQKFNDEQRDYHLSFLGYKVLRYKNDIVINNVGAIYKDIKTVKNQTPSQRERVGVREKKVLSTKKLTQTQKERLVSAGFSVTDYDAIEIEIINFSIPKQLDNAIFTSQNAVRAFLDKSSDLLAHLKGDWSGVRIFCVGQKTKNLLEENGLKVTTMSENASELAHYIVENHKNGVFHFFCGNLRREELTSALKDANIPIFEVKTYKTELKLKKFDQNWDGLLFFSPSGVESFIAENSIGSSEVICIGATTASEVKKYTKNIAIADITSVESVIEKAIENL